MPPRAPRRAEDDTISTFAPVRRREQIGQRGQPVDAGHLDVEQDEVDALAREEGERGVRSRGLLPATT